MQRPNSRNLAEYIEDREDELRAAYRTLAGKHYDTQAGASQLDIDNPIVWELHGAIQELAELSDHFRLCVD
jgi:hypothetical protein